ncbi:hypothetical protein [Halostella litorea]|uniref:hypothetical protein n=1 Tax=Halostella litorea TaxID=2528831 RepID=UPI00192A4E63|nr:hypothetical protein [Halostella litorea]
MAIETETDSSSGRDPERPKGYVVGSAPADAERELSHDEFDPVGTLTVILVYFLILVGMWVFMYFVEFLGNELTVVG